MRSALSEESPLTAGPMRGVNEQSDGGDLLASIRGALMVLLTFIFIALYTAALLGWLKPLADVTMIARLEPIIFVIIGYYFGRVPSQQNEKTLTDEIDRQTKKADASQHVKEQCQGECQALEEKMRNIKAVIGGNFVAGDDASYSDTQSLSDEIDPDRRAEANMETRLKIASRILNS